jgi:hypothetical protein
MNIKYNSTFKNLLDEYKLSSDLDFKIDLPAEVQQILSDKVVVNEFGVGLESNWKPEFSGNANDQSFHEDNENHFHVDWHIENDENKKVFELGVTTLVELAKRFENQEIKNIQFTYSFQTPEMGRIEAIQNKFDDNDLYLSDRLSFHTKRDGQTVVSEDLFKDEHYAFLTIDI